MISVLIPARNEKYLQATVDDIRRNFTTEVEIIVGLDNYWPDPALRDDPNVVIYHSPTRIGMKPMINTLAKLARGEYLMKVDAHCAFSEGYDVSLLDLLEKNPGATVLGVRYELDVDAWERRERTNCDIRYLSHPSDPKGGLRGLAWPEKNKAAKGKKVAETMTISGSGWMMPRQQFIDWGGLYEGPYTGTFGQEGAEISLKTWLSGGNVLVHRGCWYAHWNRGKSPYAMSKSQRDKSVAWSVDYWTHDKWPLQKYSFRWLIDRFAPVPGWDTAEPQHIEARRQGTLYKGMKNSFRGETDYRVDELCKRWSAICEPLKRGRLEILFSSLTEVYVAVLEGKKYTKASMAETAYYNYLISHLHPSHRDPLTRRGVHHVRKIFLDSVGLLRSIQEDGIKTPLEFYRKDGKQILYKGYRRLIAAKVLGIQRISGMCHREERTAKKLPARFNPVVPGSITEIAQKQFQEHRGRATDKYWTHGYTEIYDDAFRHLRNRKITLAEFGVARGASLAMWHEAFPRAKIVGVDKDRDIWHEFGDLPRVKMCFGRQEDEAFLDHVVVPEGPFDIFIDDCGHKPEQQMNLFVKMWPHVRRNGWYVIEDCFRSHLKKHDGPVVTEEFAKFIPQIYTDHSVLSVQFHYNVCLIRKGL